MIADTYITSSIHQLTDSTSPGLFGFGSPASFYFPAVLWLSFRTNRLVVVRRDV